MVFPSLKAKQLLAVLTRKPLCYEVVRTKGSHKRLESKYPGAEFISFAYHDNKTIPPGVVREMLVKRAGLTEEEAVELLK